MKLKNILKYAEFIIFFFGVPLLFLFNKNLIHPSAVVLPVIVFILVFLNRQDSFRFKELVRLKISLKDALLHIIIVISTGLILIAFVYFFDRDSLFNLPGANLHLFLFLSVMYPLFSAYGQEIIYRTFIWYRYKDIFKSEAVFVIASSVAFSFVHIVYFSYISLILTLFLGLYLSYTYVKTKNVLLTSIIHGIFGDIVFAIGLGSHFWLDMHKWM